MDNNNTILHDLKRIAATARELMKACDTLYNDMEKQTGSNERVSLKDIEQGGLNGNFNKYL